MSMESDGGMILTDENRRNRRKTCSSSISFTKIHTWIDPGANPGLRSERPATKRMISVPLLENWRDLMKTILLSSNKSNFNRRNNWRSDKIAKKSEPPPFLALFTKLRWGDNDKKSQMNRVYSTCYIVWTPKDLRTSVHKDKRAG
jgi:hypothetical protein